MAFGAVPAARGRRPEPVLTSVESADEIAFGIGPVLRFIDENVVPREPFGRERLEERGFSFEGIAAEGALGLRQKLGERLEIERALRYR
jgi:hypothetical protein